ncbi:MAG: hypothetical protein IJQ90_00460 [Alphaproteobacteria bacterium]|nr:hypothetical protein [Alphaproteobacteria bacterium]
MKKIIAFFAFLIGCSSANGQSCDLCGNWSFNRFEYAGYITTDCKSTAQNFYKNTSIKIEVHNTTIGEYDPDEDAHELFVKTGDDLIEKFYVSSQDSIYILSDGCRFYFKRQ